MKVKSESEVAQSCLTLSDPMDCSLPGSSVHWIFQARVLEWVAIAFSNDVWVTFKTMIVAEHVGIILARDLWDGKEGDSLDIRGTAWPGHLPPLGPQGTCLKQLNISFS